MEKLGIEFKSSSTGMYSPWHLEIAHEYNVNLMCTCDIGTFEASNEEVLKEIDDIVNNRNKDFYLEKCQPLDEFEKKIIELSNKKE